LDPADRATAPAASQPAAPKAAPAAAKDRFEATLANGVTVELIGLSRGPSQQDSWWRPDGKPLAKAPSFTGAGRSSAGEGQRYEVALEWRHLPADNAVRWEFLPCTSSSWSDNGPKEGNDITNSMAAAVSVPAWTVRATIRCGAAAGAWTTVVPAQPGGAMTTSDATGRAIAFAPAAQTGKDAALTVAHNVLDQDVRVVAVDKKGRTITSTKATGGSAGGKIVQTTFTFSNVAIDDIEKFNFQVRPFEWVEFSNVALQEGLETDVKTVLEKAGSDAQKSRPLDGNSF
jgi:hypothetical protein